MVDEGLCQKQWQYHSLIVYVSIYRALDDTERIGNCISVVVKNSDFILLTFHSETFLNFVKA